MLQLHTLSSTISPRTKQRHFRVEDTKFVPVNSVGRPGILSQVRYLLVKSFPELFQKRAMFLRIMRSTRDVLFMFLKLNWSLFDWSSRTNSSEMVFQRLFFNRVCFAFSSYWKHVFCKVCPNQNSGSITWVVFLFEGHCFPCKSMHSTSTCFNELW